jgi:hypothetical protein
MEEVEEKRLGAVHYYYFYTIKNTGTHRLRRRFMDLVCHKVTAQQGGFNTPHPCARFHVVTTERYARLGRNSILCSIFSSC